MRNEKQCVEGEYINSIFCRKERDLTIFVMQHIKKGTLHKLHASHSITMIMVSVSHVLLSIFSLGTLRLMPTSSRRLA